MKTTYLLVIICLLSCHWAWSQEEDSLQMATYKIHSISDELYWGGDQHMINKSFLSIFKGYGGLKLYSVIGLVSEDAIYGSGGGYGDKNYRPIWLLQDSVLYLRDIYLPVIDEKGLKKHYPNGKQYRIMENLTKRKFVADDDSLKTKTPPSCQFGSMRADWVTGVFYVKKIRRWQGEEESTREWQAAPFQKLIFRDGKLLSVENVKPGNP